MIFLRHFANVGLILFVLTQLIALSDFFLTSEQKKRIDNFIEEITLKLDYVRTIEWLKQWLKGTRRAQIGLIMFALIGVAGCAVTSGFPVSPKTLGLPLDLDPDFPPVLTIPFWWLGWLVIGTAVSRIGGPMMKVLSESKTFGEFAEKYLLMMILGGVLAAGAATVSYELVTVREGHPILPPAIVSSYLGAFIIGWVLLLLDGIVTLIGAGCVMVSRGVVVVARRSLWKLASYPKGPTAALTTIAGTILAVLRFLVLK